MGHRYVSMQQVLAADRQVWLLLAQDSRNCLRITAGQDPPLDDKFEKLTTSPEVTSCMTHLPSASGSSSSQQNSAKTPDHSKRSQPAKPLTQGTKSAPPKGGGKNTDSIGYMLKNMPENCVSKLDNGKFICLRYQFNKCKFQKKKQCQNGVHQCFYKGCHKERPYSECSH